MQGSAFFLYLSRENFKTKLIMRELELLKHTTHNQLPVSIEAAQVQILVLEVVFNQCGTSLTKFRRSKKGALKGQTKPLSLSPISC